MDDRSEATFKPVDSLEYAWKYFSLHADQRLRTFHFFLILAALVIGGSLTAAGNGVLPIAGTVINLYALVPISFLFWKLDERNKFLVKHSEKVLKRIESEAQGRMPNLFTDEEEETRRLRDKQSGMRVWEANMTYGDIFRWVFLCVAGLGITMGTVVWVC